MKKGAAVFGDGIAFPLFLKGAALAPFLRFNTTSNDLYIYIVERQRRMKKMASLNKVLLIGNLTGEPELKQTASGKSVCNFSVAVNRPMAKEGQKDVDFINVVVWGKTAEFVASYFGKGDPMFIMGQMQNRDWTDDAGQKHYVTEVLADDVQFVKSKSDGSTSDSGKKNSEEE